MSEQLSKAALIINNTPVFYSPNSLTYDEGLGEQAMRAMAGGGNQIEAVFSDNVEARLGMVKVDLPSTLENIALVRQWKQNKDQNLVQIVGRTSEGNFNKTFAQAAITNRYEVPLTNDGVISLEFTSQPAV